MNTEQSKSKLLFAVLTVKYEAPRTSFTQALSQTKMYLETSVRLHASFGIANRAVFGLATNSVNGAVLMVWCSISTDAVSIVERNVRAFNIFSPLQVYHFVTFILRLRRSSDKALGRIVEDALENTSFKQSSWNKPSSLIGFQRYHSAAMM
ncbi:uncharacterized protein EV420DRAFT_93051 [Desarmillaria tabescens]|uniref:Uncharacterized protein n=1 Tax=Armillaria tabescens TaxID=1929756 RepID=A0AA39NQT2_ARMTA|nr:uncharacterized protein EV420DRAFT_93051 [Desarmillaria tabescens]KAK0470152.1 hypothetical protein EV420DRAFT_93051 [Desarmillaria tabescens]